MDQRTIFHYHHCISHHSSSYRRQTDLAMLASTFIKNGILAVHIYAYPQQLSGAMFFSLPFCLYQSTSITQTVWIVRFPLHLTWQNIIYVASCEIPLVKKHGCMLSSLTCDSVHQTNLLHPSQHFLSAHTNCWVSCCVIDQISDPKVKVSEIGITKI